jgi:hypothetical protein
MPLSDLQNWLLSLGSFRFDRHCPSDVKEASDGLFRLGLMQREWAGPPGQYDGFAYSITEVGRAALGASIH